MAFQLKWKVWMSGGFLAVSLLVLLFRMGRSDLNDDCSAAAWQEFTLNPEAHSLKVWG